MRSRLPGKLNPACFKASLNPYCDDYEDRYSIDYEGHGFLIDNRVPFTLHLCEGFAGDDVHERRWIVNLLRIATYILRETGRWPEISTEWAGMCPGGIVKVNVTPLAATQSSESPLPEVLASVSSRIKKALNSRETEFSEAENYYRGELEGLSCVQPRDAHNPAGIR